MSIYIIVLLLMILICFLFKNSNLKKYSLKNYNSMLILIISSILITLYTIRSETVGWDTSNYIYIFENIAPTENIFNSYLEPGWLLLNKIIYLILPKKWFFFFVISTICFLLWAYILKRLSSNVGLSFIILYMLGIYFNLMNQQRNMLAISITFLSFLFFYEKKYVKSILVVFVAAMIHKSALIFLLFYFTIYTSKYMSKKIINFLLVVFAIVYFNFNSLFNFFTNYFYTAYVTGNTSVNHINSGNSKMLIIHLFLILFIVLIDLKINKSNKKNFVELKKILYIAVSFVLMLDILSLKVSIISRFSGYFSIYFVILIPNIIEEVKNFKNRYLIKTVLLFVLFFYMIIYLRFSEKGFGHDGVIPYQIGCINQNVSYVDQERKVI